jgi:hypothetical protein
MIAIGQTYLRFLLLAAIIIAFAPRAFGDEKLSLPSGWQQLSMSELAVVIEQIYADHPEREFQHDRTQICWDAGNRHFTDEKQFRESLAADPHGLVMLTEAVKLDIPGQFGYAVRDWFVESAHDKRIVASLSFSDLDRLNNTMLYWRAPISFSALMATQWASTSEEYAHLDSRELTDLAEMVCADISAESRAFDQAIANRAWNEFLGQPAYIQSTDLTNLVRAVRVFAPNYDPARQRDLLQNMLQRFRASRQDLVDLPAPKLLHLTAELRKLGASDDQIIDLLTAWSAARDSSLVYAIDDPDLYIQFAAYQVISQRADDPLRFSQLLRQKLYSDQTPIGPTTGRLLAFAAGHQTGPNNLQDELKSRLALSGLDGDVAAGLLLVEANTSELNAGRPDKLAGTPQAREALGRVQSDAMRFALSEWLARRLTVADQSSAADAVLNDAIAHCTDPKVVHQLYILSDQMALLADATEGMQRHLAEKQAIQLKGQLAYLQQQLETAKAQNRSDLDIRSLQQLVQNTRIAINNLN